MSTRASRSLAALSAAVEISVKSAIAASIGLVVWLPLALAQPQPAPAPQAQPPAQAAEPQPAPQAQPQPQPQAQPQPAPQPTARPKPPPDATPAPPVDPEDEDDPDEGIRRRPAPDMRRWHWLIEGRAGLIAPGGSFGSGIRAGALASAGPSFGGALGLGVSRQVFLEGFGSYGLFASGSRCTDCSGQGFDIGLGLTYHVAQGLAFDPWLSFGVAYRSLTVDGTVPFEAGGGTTAEFRGMDVARLALGGSYYPIPSLGFGPYLGVALGTFLDRPDVGAAADDEGAQVYAFFQLGVRVSFDPVLAVRGLPTAPSQKTAFAGGRWSGRSPSGRDVGVPKDARPAGETSGSPPPGAPNGTPKQPARPSAR